MKSLVSPSYFKQQAKRLKKEKSLTHAESLDEYAKLCGFSNYRNYLNELSAKKEINHDAEFQRILSESEVFKKAELLAKFIQKFGAPFRDVFGVLQTFQNSEVAVQSVCEHSVLKNEIQKFMIGYFQSEEMREAIQDFRYRKFYVAKDVAVKNLKYRMIGKLLHVFGEYELEVECALNLPIEEQLIEKNLNPAPMFGDFQLTLDENGRMVIANSSIREKVNDEINETKVNHGRLDL